MRPGACWSVTTRLSLSCRSLGSGLISTITRSRLAGRIGLDDEMHLATGSLAERRFAAIYDRVGRLVGVLGFNRPRHMMRYRMLIESDTSFEDAIAAVF